MIKKITSITKKKKRKIKMRLKTPTCTDLTTKSFSIPTRRTTEIQSPLTVR